MSYPNIRVWKNNQNREAYTVTSRSRRIKQKLHGNMKRETGETGWENGRGWGEKLVSAVQEDITRNAKNFTELVFNV